MTTGRGPGHHAGVRVNCGMLAIAAGLAGATLNAVNALAGRGFEGSFWLVLAVASVSFGAVGVVLAARSTARRVPDLMVATGLGQGLSLLLLEYAILGPLPLAELAMWLASWLWAPSLFLSATVLVLLLPDGTLASPRWRPALTLSWVVLGLHAVLWALTPYQNAAPPIVVRDLTNPVGLTVAAAPAFQVVLGLGTLAAAGLALASLVSRWRRSSGDARQQLKWLALGAAVAVLLFGLGVVAPLPWGELLVGLAAVPMPMAMGVAALRHRLWDVDLAISTGLRYALLSAIAMAVYTVVVSLLGAVSGAPVVATAAVALVLLPLHDRLRLWVNHLVHGEGDDPDTALARLGVRLEETGDPADVADRLLPVVVDRLAGLLRSPFAVIELADGTVVGHGDPSEPVERIELHYAGSRVGVLSLAGRTRSPGERSRLDRVSAQAAVAVHSVLATREARLARQLVVAAREEERRRLRWDLHDGVAPLLAGLALQAETARDIVHDDPDAARAILDRLVPNLAGAVADVRAIVHELRPPSLDELGVVGAVAELAARFDRPERRVVVSADRVDGLPAAVDLAAYRITAEALNNAVRHADASLIEISLRGVGSELQVRITDDGHGLPIDGRGGVGLDSMRSRAEELGGRFSVVSTPQGGTTVTADLPTAMGGDEA